MTVRERPSPNVDSRDGRAVDMLVLHYTGMPSADEAIERLCDPEAKVSAHYLIDEDGSVWQLADEAMRAWHAGVAHWRGATDINARSVGIELVNPGHEWGYRAFPEAQIEALIPLARDIVSRHVIPARNIVGHSDVAPTRKTDPGELFEWRRLADAGIGVWPEDIGAHPPMGTDFMQLLREIGYDTSDPPAAVRAFQRRFRPSLIDGLADDETVLIAAAVARNLAGN